MELTRRAAAVRVSECHSCVLVLRAGGSPGAFSCAAYSSPWVAGWPHDGHHTSPFHAYMHRLQAHCVLGCWPVTVYPHTIWCLSAIWSVIVPFRSARSLSLVVLACSRSSRAGVVDDVEPREDSVEDCPQDRLVEAPRDCHRDCASKADSSAYS